MNKLLNRKLNAMLQPTKEKMGVEIQVSFGFILFSSGLLS